MSGEVAKARPAVEREIGRLSELAGTLKHRKDTNRRRVRKQRTSIYEWSEGIHDVEATRVIHVS